MSSRSFSSELAGAFIGAVLGGSLGIFAFGGLSGPWAVVGMLTSVVVGFGFGYLVPAMPEFFRKVSLSIQIIREAWQNQPPRFAPSETKWTPSQVWRSFTRHRLYVWIGLVVHLGILGFSFDLLTFNPLRMWAPEGFVVIAAMGLLWLVGVPFVITSAFYGLFHVIIGWESTDDVYHAFSRPFAWIKHYFTVRLREDDRARVGFASTVSRGFLVFGLLGLLFVPWALFDLLVYDVPVMVDWTLNGSALFAAVAWTFLFSMTAFSLVNDDEVDDIPKDDPHYPGEDDLEAVRSQRRADRMAALATFINEHGLVNATLRLTGRLFLFVFITAPLGLLQTIGIAALLGFLFFIALPLWALHWRLGELMNANVFRRGLVTTLLITCATAWFTQGLLHGQLWLAIALGNGLLCGVVSVSMIWGVNWAFERSERFRLFIETGVGSLVWTTVALAEEKIYDPLHAKLSTPFYKRRVFPGYWGV